MQNFTEVAFGKKKEVQRDDAKTPFRCHHQYHRAIAVMTSLYPRLRLRPAKLATNIVQRKRSAKAKAKTIRGRKGQKGKRR